MRGRKTPNTMIMLSFKGKIRKNELESGRSLNKTIQVKNIAQKAYYIKACIKIMAGVLLKVNLHSEVFIAVLLLN